MNSCACACLKLGKLGVAETKLVISRTAFAAGERVSLAGSYVSNNTARELRVRVVLRQLLSLNAYVGSTSTSNEFALAPEVRIAAGGKFSFTEDASQSMEALIPAVSPTFIGALGEQAARRDPLVVTYTVCLKVDIPSKSMGTCQQVILPVCVVAAPPFPEAIAAAAAAGPIKAAELVNSTDAPLATDLSQACNTAPLMLGQWADPRGTAMQPAVPINGRMLGPVTYLEDRGQEVGGVTSLQPVVFAFPDANTRPVELQGVSVVPSYAGLGSASASVVPESFNEASASQPGGIQTVAPVIPASAPTEQGGGGGGFDALLSALDSGYYKDQEVAKWASANTALAAALSPGQVKEVLQKVSFSLEQAGVAASLARAISPVTCAHVTAAVEACPFAKAGVIGAMAPYVTDAQNSGSLLEVVYAFERDSLKAKFGTAL